MKKILVGYSSVNSSTKEVAEAIAAQLCQRGEAAEALNLKDVHGVSSYDAVVVGSAVRTGHWLPDAVNFVKKNAESLRKLPVAYFSVHLQALDESAVSRKQRELYVAPVHQILEPQAEAFFAGKMDLSSLTWFDRLLAKMTGTKDVDLRDWSKIRQWADQLFLSQSTASSAGTTVRVELKA